MDRILFLLVALFPCGLPDIFEFCLPDLVHFFSDINIAGYVPPVSNDIIRHIDPWAKCFCISPLTAAAPIHPVPIGIDSAVKRMPAFGAEDLIHIGVCFLIQRPYNRAGFPVLSLFV